MVWGMNEVNVLHGSCVHVTLSEWTMIYYLAMYNMPCSFHISGKSPETVHEP